MKHNVAHMISSQSLGKYQSHAFLSGICVAKNSTSVESFCHENIPHFIAFMSHDLAKTWECSMTICPASIMARTSVLCMHFLLQIWASATTALTTSTSCFTDTKGTVCLKNLSSKSPLESHTGGGGKDSR